MSVSDIVDALEAGLITETEAAEQGLVDSIDDLYHRLAGRSGSWGDGATGRGKRESRRVAR